MDEWMDGKSMIPAQARNDDKINIGGLLGVKAIKKSIQHCGADVRPEGLSEI